MSCMGQHATRLGLGLLLLVAPGCEDEALPEAAPGGGGPVNTGGGSSDRPDAGPVAPAVDAGEACDGADGNSLVFADENLGDEGTGTQASTRWDTRRCDDATLQVIMFDDCGAANGDVLILSLNRDALEGTLLLMDSVDIFQGDILLQVELNDSGAPLAGPWVPCGSTPVALTLTAFGSEPGDTLSGSLVGTLAECDSLGLESNPRQVSANFNVIIEESFEDACLASQ